MGNDLSKRAIGLKGWRWMPGMLVQTAEGQSWRLDECDEWAGQPPVFAFPEWFPDLTDPATLGCLLARVREAWGDEHLHIGRRIAGWGVWTSASTPMPQCVGKGDTEAEALVAALEAAEGREVSDE